MLTREGGREAGRYARTDRRGHSLQPHISVLGEKELGGETERESQGIGRRELVLKPEGMCFSQRDRMNADFIQFSADQQQRPL